MRTKPKVSVITGTFRLGGIDILLAGMRDQTFKDFEYILVDHRYEFRHKKVMEMARNYGVNLIHVPEHKRNGKWHVQGAALNTGFMLAEGEIIIMLLDYGYAPAGWIERHLRHHYDENGNRLNKLIMAPHCYVSLPPIIFKKPVDLQLWLKKQKEKGAGCLIQEKFEDYFDEISIFGCLFDPRWIAQLEPQQPPHQDPKLLLPSGPTTYPWFHMKNESFPLEKIIEVNGIDETFDLSKGHMDTELGFRLSRVIDSLELDKDNIVFCPNPRPIMSTMPWGSVDESLEGRWSNKQLHWYEFKRYAEMDAGAPPVAPNDYSLREKREELLRWKELDTIPTGNLG